MSIKASPELQAVCRRWIKALTENETATLVNLYSKSTTATYLDTDNPELWIGRDVGLAASRHWTEVAQEVGLTSVENEDIDDYDNGNTGWALVRSPRVRLRKPFETELKGLPGSHTVIPVS